MPHIDDEYLLFVFPDRKTEFPEKIVNKIRYDLVETREVFEPVKKEHQNKRDHKRKYDIHVCVGLLFYKRIFLFPSEDCKAHFFISFPFI